MATKLVVPRVTMLYDTPTTKAPAVCVPPEAMTLNVAGLPSLIEVGCVAKLYTVDAAAEVSVTVTDADVASTVPVIETVLMLTVKSCGPSVERSATGLTLKVPALLLITNDPVTATKSAFVVELLLIVQYSVVPLATPDVVTLNVPSTFSLIAVGVVENVYSVGVIDVSLIVYKPEVA